MLDVGTSVDLGLNIALAEKFEQDSSRYETSHFRSALSLRRSSTLFPQKVMEARSHVLSVWGNGGREFNVVSQTFAPRSYEGMRSLLCVDEVIAKKASSSNGFVRTGNGVLVRIA